MKQRLCSTDLSPLLNLLNRTVSYNDFQAFEARNIGKKLIDDLTPDISIGDNGNRIAPWDYGTRITDNQKRLAAQNFLKIAKTLQ